MDSNNARRSSASALAGTGAGDEGDYDDAGEDRDMILFKKDFDMLHALHRFVPLPALSSNILRIICDDDLQVANEDDEGEDDDDESPAIPTEEENAGGGERDEKLARTMKVSVKTSGPVLSGIAAAYGGEVPKHSPLTRRLSKKPHIEISLVSPQYQKKTSGSHIQQQQQQLDHPENNNERGTSYGSNPSNLSFSTSMIAG